MSTMDPFGYGSKGRPGEAPILPVEMPTCLVCGEQVVANLCGATPRTDQSVAAIQAVLLAAHNRLVHDADWPWAAADLPVQGEPR